MPGLVVILPLALLLAARLWAQRRLKRRAPLVTPPRGHLSVVAWLLLFLVTLASAVEAAWAGRVSPGRLGAGLGLIASALALRAVALARLGAWYHEGIAVREGHRVVRDGIYRYLRHPLHLALVVEMAGLAALGGQAAGALATALAVGVLLVRNLAEERALSRALGDPYREYLATRAWDLVDVIPPWRHLSGYRGRPLQPGGSP